MILSDITPFCAASVGATSTPSTILPSAARTSLTAEPMCFACDLVKSSMDLSGPSANGSELDPVMASPNRPGPLPPATTAADILMKSQTHITQEHIIRTQARHEANMALKAGDYANPAYGMQRAAEDAMLDHLHQRINRNVDLSRAARDMGTSMHGAFEEKLMEASGCCYRSLPATSLGLDGVTAFECELPTLRELISSPCFRSRTPIARVLPRRPVPG